MHLLQKVTILGCVLLGIVSLCSQPLMAANSVQVGNCQNQNGYPTISAAIAAVPPGGNVLVCPGTYPEQVVISKPLNLAGIQSGTNAAAVIVPPNGGLTPNTTRVSQILTPGRAVAAQILVNAPTGSVNLNNLTVDGTGNNLAQCPVIIAGIYYRAASGTVNNVATRNQVVGQDCDRRGFGVLGETGGTSSAPVSASLTVKNSTMRVYQNVGLTADDFGMTVLFVGNTIAGPEPYTVNGIQMVGATGQVKNNSVIETFSIYSTGILADASHAVLISGNSVEMAGVGIGVSSDDSIQGDADYSTVQGNVVFDALYPGAGSGAVTICSSNDQVQSNVINSSRIAAVFVDTCGNSTYPSTNNTIKSNTINEACAGVLLNTSGNTTSSNQFSNVVNTVLNGNSCSPTLAPQGNAPTERRINIM